jgi:hypothetical protein
MPPSVFSVRSVVKAFFRSFALHPDIPVYITGGLEIELVLNERSV